MSQAAFFVQHVKQVARRHFFGVPAIEVIVADSVGFVDHYLFVFRVDRRVHQTDDGFGLRGNFRQAVLLAQGVIGDLLARA